MICFLPRFISFTSLLLLVFFTIVLACGDKPFVPDRPPERCVRMVVPCPKNCRNSCIYPDLPCPMSHEPRCPQPGDKQCAHVACILSLPICPEECPDSCLVKNPPQPCCPTVGTPYCP